MAIELASLEEHCAGSHDPELHARQARAIHYAQREYQAVRGVTFEGWPRVVPAPGMAGAYVQAWVYSPEY